MIDARLWPENTKVAHLSQKKHRLRIFPLDHTSAISSAGILLNPGGSLNFCFGFFNTRRFNWCVVSNFRIRQSSTRWRFHSVEQFLKVFHSSFLDIVGVTHDVSLVFLTETCLCLWAPYATARTFLFLFSLLSFAIRLSCHKLRVSPLRAVLCIYGRLHYGIPRRTNHSGCVWFGGRLSFLQMFLFNLLALTTFLPRGVLLAIYY